jgi:hypothetical protein
VLGRGPELGHEEAVELRDGPLGLPSRLQSVIRERMMAIDTDNEEQAIVAEHWREMLRLLHHDAEDCCVFVPSALAAEWLAIATRENRGTPRASAHLGGLGLPEIRKSKKDGILGWVWTGPNAPPRSTARWYNKRSEKGEFY